MTRAYHRAAPEERPPLGSAALRETLPLLPLLLVFATIVVAFSPRSLIPGDPIRYLLYAENLARGDYASFSPDFESAYGSVPPSEQPLLWNGPGYPLVLAPFVALKAPRILTELLNGLLLFGAVIYFYLTVRRHAERRAAIGMALAFGLFPPFLRWIPFLYTESLCIFLVCGFLYHQLRFLEGGGRGSGVLASAFLAYLALTKILFGYAILAVGALCLVLGAFRRTRSFLRAVPVYALALIFCLPYLVYTHSLTGKVFYWGSSGGLQLYCMTTPYPEEYGDWFNPTDVLDKPELARHRPLFEEAALLPPVERDERFREAALANLRAHPLKFAFNWVCNMGRLWFSLPFSYDRQRPHTFFYIVPGMFLVVLTILSAVPAWRARSRIPLEVWVALVFGCVAFGGSSLVSARARMLVPVFPVIFLWLGYCANRLVVVRLRE